MSKGNPLFGQMRGKVGDLVFTRNAGEQVTRSRNRRPKNPQTTKQMAQRAALATCVEFFTRGQRNLFKFAFESKKPGESDYNAFVRANIGNVPVQSHKSLLENNTVFGPFIMSQGSLAEPAFDFSYDNIHGAILTTAVGKVGNQLTIGDVSKAIIAKNGYLDGDIITIVAITGKDDMLISSINDAMSYGSLQQEFGDQKWTILQFTLNSSSTDLASTLGIFDLSEVTAQTLSLPFSTDVMPDLFNDDEYSCALGVIVSRNTASGLKVSTSKLKLSYRTDDTSNIGMTDEWKTYVAKHWNDANTLDAQPEDILKGSLSKN